MSRSTRTTLWLALFALLATPALAAASAKTPRKTPSKKTSKPAEAPRPTVPQELPPVPPSVTYRGGLLTIVAQNSTLADILMAVRKATGAQVDAPASATERVATRLGPGQPRDVLSELLNGSRFDYILLSSRENPGGVRRLILAPRTGGETGASSPPESSGITFQPSPAGRAPGVRALPPDTSEEEDVEPEQSVQPAEEVPAEPPPQQEIKTPEQLQEELRQHEEEQRQQQQEQPQPPQEQPQ